MIKNKVDLVVSFDTTGSMYPVLAQVRQEVESFVHQVFSEFTDLRLGIIAHGDYYDKNDPYTIRVMDFTRDETKLRQFVVETKRTCGGDSDECYELVLNTAHKVLNWREDADKVMILIGDAAPHGVDYYDNVDNLDWRKEATKLGDRGVKIFAVHALSYYRQSSKYFYKEIASRTEGVYLTLDQFNEILDLIKATCYQRGGEEKLTEFISIIRDTGKLTSSMEANFKRLQGEDVPEIISEREISERYRSSKRRRSAVSGDVTIKEMGELVPVMPGRFQVMTVDKDTPIKEFVEYNGITFKKGRGFYQLSKAETVQQYKEVIMQDKETGDMFVGTQVREKLGLLPQTEAGGANERIHKDAAKDFNVFVQSTSINRKLIAGTIFLYEVSDLEDVGTVVEKTSAVKETKTATKETKKTEKETKTASKLTKRAIKAAEKAEKSIIVDKKASTTKAKKEKEADKSVSKKSTVITKKKVEQKTKVEEPKRLFKDSSALTETSDKLFGKTVVLESKKIVNERKEAITEKQITDMVNQMNKVNDALDRYSKSTNKKNTEFLNNNVNKLIKMASGIVENLGCK